MATVNLSVLDKRTTDGKVNQRCDWMSGAVNAKYRITVDANMPLDRFFRTVKSRLGKGNRIGILTILCHGFGVTEYFDEAKTKAKRLHGGFGLEFCKENVNLKTAWKFKALHGLFASRSLGIKFMGCAAASEQVVRIVPSGKETKRSFGRRMCWAVARVAGTGVMASSDIQEVHVNIVYRRVRSGWVIKDVQRGKCVDPGRWEGKVWIFTPDRKVRRHVTK